MNDIYNDQDIPDNNDVKSINLSNDNGEDQHSFLFNLDKTFYDTIVEETCKNLREDRSPLNERCDGEAMEFLRSLDEETSDEIEENFDEVEEEIPDQIEEEIFDETEAQEISPEYIHEDERKYAMHLNLSQRKTFLDDTFSRFYLEMIFHMNQFSESTMKQIYRFAY